MPLLIYSIKHFKVTRALRVCSKDVFLSHLVHSYLVDKRAPFRDIPYSVVFWICSLVTALLRYIVYGVESVLSTDINLLKPTGYVMHQQFNIQQTVPSAHTVFMCFAFI